MAKLVYTALTSLDGFTEDAGGRFDWAQPDESVHRFVNDLERGIGIQLIGRRMYEVMQIWETDPSFTESDPILRDYAGIWQAAEKIVYSTTLKTPVTRRTRIEPRFDPEQVRDLKAAGGRDLGIGGPALAAHAFRAGLVDEIQLFIFPVAVGTGKPALPKDVRIDLTLLDERRFESGVVYLRYQVDLAGL